MFHITLKLRISEKLFFSLAFVCLLPVGGCGDFFAQKPTELESQAILNDMKQLKEPPQVANPVPEMYRSGASKIAFGEGTKLFYFTKHHSASELARLVNVQFNAGMATDNKGVTVYTPRYAIAENAATNQLVVDCPSEEEADDVLAFLQMVDVPPIQVNIDCMIVERFADMTMDWETTILVENLFGEDITLGGKTGPGGELLPTFPGASLRESRRSEFGLNIGVWRNKGVLGHQFLALVDMLISRGYLKVLMNPTLETVNGKKAMVESRDNVPIEKVVTGRGVEPYSITDYQWVADSLEVIPNVYSDGSIGLTTAIVLGSKSKPEGVVQASIITERRIEVAENRIMPGDSLVIGGIKKTEERAVIRGVPFLKDIPLLGVLFSSKDVEEKGNEVIFILTPSISSGGVEYADMLDDVRKRMMSPEYERKLQDVITDPLGSGAYAEMVEEKAAQAELEKIKAEIQSAEAQGEVDLVKEKLYKTAEEVLAEKSKAARTRSQMLQIHQEIEQLKSESEAGKAQLEELQKKLEQTEAEKAAAEMQGQQRLEELQKSQEQLQAEAARVKKEAEEAKKRLEELEKASAEAEQERAEAPAEPENKEVQQQESEQPPQSPAEPNDSAPDRQNPD